MRWCSESHPSMPNWEFVVPGFCTKLVNQPTRQPASQPTPKADDNVNVFEKIELHMLQPKNSKQNFLQAHYRFNTNYTNQPIVGPLMMANLDMATTDGHYGWALMGIWWGLKLQSSLKMTYNNCGSSTKTYLSSSARQRQQTSSSNGNKTKSIRNSSYLRVCHFWCAVFVTVFFCLLRPNHSFARAYAPTLFLSLSLSHFVEDLVNLDG